MTLIVEERPVATAVPAPTAASFATLPTARTLTTMPNEFLSFRLSAEEYGIDIPRVQEIRSYEAPTYIDIADAPHFIKGVVNCAV